MKLRTDICSLAAIINLGVAVYTGLSQSNYWSVTKAVLWQIMHPTFIITLPVLCCSNMKPLGRCVESMIMSQDLLGGNPKELQSSGVSRGAGITAGIKTCSVSPANLAALPVGYWQLPVCGHQIRCWQLKIKIKVSVEHMSQPMWHLPKLAQFDPN